jgi:hypothetical protein
MHRVGKDLVLPTVGALVLVEAVVHATNGGAGLAQVTCQLFEEGIASKAPVAFGPPATVDIAAGSVFGEVALSGAVEIGGEETYDLQVRCKKGSVGQTTSVGEVR